ncbi:MAG: hypothetical protein N2513_10570 [Deltaproteobacteria bacterium]|nr:hypothetical protein [Deltaproteobacteria bacterium]
MELSDRAVLINRLKKLASSNLRCSHKGASKKLRLFILSSVKSGEEDFFIEEGKVYVCELKFHSYKIYECLIKRAVGGKDYFSHSYMGAFYN